MRQQAALQLRDEGKLLFLVLNDVVEDVRFAAVKGLSNDTARKRVVAEGTCSRSRKLAFSMIKETSVLIEILRDETVADEFRVDAITKAEPGREFLLSLVRSDPSIAVRQAALERLPACAELSDCYFSHDPLSFRLRLIEKLTDPKLIRRIAMTDKASAARKAAIGRMENREDLMRIFREEPAPDIRLAAAGQIREEPLLLELLKEEDNETVRSGICSLLTSEELLVDVAQNDYNPAVRLAAVRKINSSRLLMTLLRDEPDAKVRREAFSRISDEEECLDLACSAPDEQIRIRAVSQVKNQALLRKISSTSPFSDSRWTASRRLKEGDLRDLLSISSSFVLAAIAGEETDEKLRALVIRGIRDEEILRKLSESTDHYTAEAARVVLGWEKGARGVYFSPIPGRPYGLSTFPVTVGEWEAVMGSLPAHLSDADRDLPATGVTPEVAVVFCEKLSSLDGHRCRLPSLDEWRHAALAGNDSDLLERTLAKEKEGSLVPPPVHLGGSGPRGRGYASPNAWGLLDAIGNVAIWVDDEVSPAGEATKRSGYDKLSKGDLPASRFAMAAGNHWDDKRVTPGRWERLVCLENLGGYGRDKVGIRLIREREPTGDWQHRLILLPEPKIGLSREQVIEKLVQMTVFPRSKLEHYFGVAPVVVNVSSDYASLRNLKKAWDRAGAVVTIKTES